MDRVRINDDSAGNNGNSSNGNQGKQYSARNYKHTMHGSRPGFAKGTKAGPGNPHAGKVAELRAALFQEVTRADIRRVTREIIELAKAGNIKAAKLIFDRALGKMPVDLYLTQLPEERQKDLAYL